MNDEVKAYDECPKCGTYDTRENLQTDKHRCIVYPVVDGVAQEPVRKDGINVPAKKQ